MDNQRLCPRPGTDGQPLLRVVGKFWFFVFPRVQQTSFGCQIRDCVTHYRHISIAADGHFRHITSHCDTVDFDGVVFVFCHCREGCQHHSEKNHCVFHVIKSLIVIILLYYCSYKDASMTRVSPSARRARALRRS